MIRQTVKPAALRVGDIVINPITGNRRDDRKQPPHARPQAKALIRLGLDNKTIERITALPLETVQQLREEVNREDKIE